MKNNRVQGYAADPVALQRLRERDTADQFSQRLHHSQSTLQPLKIFDEPDFNPDDLLGLIAHFLSGQSTGDVLLDEMLEAVMTPTPPLSSSALSAPEPLLPFHPTAYEYLRRPSLIQETAPPSPEPEPSLLAAPEEDARLTTGWQNLWDADTVHADGSTDNTPSGLSTSRLLKKP